jgi:Niemann-Pick C1 protein
MYVLLLTAIKICYFSLFLKMINKFIFIVLLFNNLYLLCYTKCVMYDACHSQLKVLTGSDNTNDPISNNKWYNCYSNKQKTSVSINDYIEPREIIDQHGIHLYKKLCPMMYQSDHDKVCCSANQLKILENDLNTAENIIGSCSSCFLNFRTMWCHMACANDQETFMRPEVVEKKVYTNLTDYFVKYREKMDNMTIEEENENYKEEEEVMKEEENEEEEEANHDVKKRETIPNGQELSVITRINYYLSEEFVKILIKSCYSVRLYTIIGLQAICGVAPKDCTPFKLGNYLGLEVSNRPMNINFKINKTGLTFTESDQTLTPRNPKAYNCNESYVFHDIEYGSKCSCQSCEESCDITQPPIKQLDFKIGNIDGVIVVMLLIYLLFIIVFLTIILVKRFRSNRVKYHRNPEIIVTDNNNNSNNNNNKSNTAYRMYNFNYYLQKMDYFGEIFENMVERRFANLGRFCASYPKLVLILGLSFCSLLCLGFVNFKVEKDPVKLWSAESSIARQNKKYFDENFGPFYRITQLIITSKNEQDTNALNVDVVQESFDLYEKLLNLTSFCKECNEERGQRIHLNDICFKPLSPSNDNCAIQSIFEYWKNDHDQIKTRLKKKSHINYLEDCFNNPVQHTCLSSYNAPLAPYLVIGGYNETNYNESKALVITFVINNQKKEESLKRAMSWEGAALGILKNFTSSKINVYYTTERSIEDEIERESTADIKIIIISYIAMFLYLTLTLGKYSSIKISVMLLETKVFLGLAGVTLVLLSVFSSGGFFTYIGVPATLITLEVIPFLLLAVGVDNIYVMVQTYQNDERRPKEKVEDQIARVVGKVGPSMLLSGVTQSVAFLISAMTPMPGVRAFSLYASLAIILNFILQITCFVVLLTLDAKREDSKRLDILCFIKLPCDTNEGEHPKKSFLHRFFSKFYTPFILNDYIRPLIIIIFMGFFFVCVSFCDKIKIGFDQKLAMPTDSYQIKYFNALEKYLAVGAPVYFVVKGGFNYTNPDDLRKLCGSPTCREDSLQTIISKASFHNFSYIAEPPVNWIDDYMDWLKPGHKCCLVYKNTTNKFCDSNIEDESDRRCKKCEEDRNNTHRIPKKESFLNYVKYFLQQNPSEICPKGGHAMYKSAVKLNLDGDEFDLSSSNYEKRNVESVEASHFMTYHTVLSKSEDFINAMVYANQLAQTITDTLNINNTNDIKYEVFPYR